eukprot:361767-Chlamydomonas_euryale.AAC.2
MGGRKPAGLSQRAAEAAAATAAATRGRPVTTCIISGSTRAAAAAAAAAAAGAAAEWHRAWGLRGTLEEVHPLRADDGAELAALCLLSALCIGSGLGRRATVSFGGSLPQLVCEAAGAGAETPSPGTVRADELASS